MDKPTIPDGQTGAASPRAAMAPSTVRLSPGVPTRPIPTGLVPIGQVKVARCRLRARSRP